MAMLVHQRVSTEKPWFLSHGFCRHLPGHGLFTRHLALVDVHPPQRQLLHHHLLRGGNGGGEAVQLDGAFATATAAELLHFGEGSWKS